jgi:spore photoproduct lyase
MNTIISPLSDRKTLVTAVNKGEFLKPCPGTAKGYLCCGYQILTPLTGCGMYCSYCVLQAYFEHQHQVVYENFGDLEEEVRRKLSSWHGVIRLGTGEFADSLFQEDNLGLCKKVADLLEPYPNAIVEFKTKSDSLSGLSKIRNPRKVIIGFSMNTPAMIALHERGTAPLDKRLSLIKQCADMGFSIGIHFDPIFHYHAWETDYREVVGRIFEHIKNPDAIAWWSMGGFRANPGLKKLLKRTDSHLPLFGQNDMILGEDGKYRYFRPIRAAFYRAFQDEVAKHAPEIALYLCMESKDVWEEAGMFHRIPRGLVRYLDIRAEKLLGISSLLHADKGAQDK